MSLFVRLLKALAVNGPVEGEMYDLAKLRCDFAMEAALEGLGLTFDDGVELLRDEDVEGGRKDVRDRVVAALDNLADFSVCEEYHMAEELPSLDDEIDWDEIDGDDLSEDDRDLLDPYLAVCFQYNKTYREVEDGDIGHAARIALSWLAWADSVLLTYMTQNDDRVRPWHYALQGFTARKSEFPEWMIPPIEWACRCYLVVGVDGGLDLRGVRAQAGGVDYNPVFKESLAKCGRIFSDEHPYFSVKEEDMEALRRMSDRIKDEYYGR